MPSHLICDVHEWINDLSTVPKYCSVKPQQCQQALKITAGQEDPFEFDFMLL